VKFYLISLGCAKNLVDSETLAGRMTRSGFTRSDSLEKATLVILNTCAFIQPAKEEAIEEILKLAEWKKRRTGRKILVCGCLPERYREQIVQQFPEVDFWAGVHDQASIPAMFKKENKKLGGAPFREAPRSYEEGGLREVSSPPHWAYLKIAEGCDHRCTFCVIPAIRGKYRSRRPEDILDEARQLALRGAKELNLIAQDTTAYGKDLPGKPALSELLKQLCRLPKLKWIRVLYAHPQGLSEDLLDVMAGEKKICRYLDLPLQHADSSILRRMGRTGNGREFLLLLKRLRKRLPGITVRTSFIVGFPGEGEKEFQNLLEFVEEARFDKVGAFAYSREEGTPSERLLPRVHHATRERRLRVLMEKQQSISLEKNLSLIGSTLPVLVEGLFDGKLTNLPGAGHQGSSLWVGRSCRDAPEVDGCVFFTSRDALRGDILNVKITGAEPYDLTGEIFDADAKA